LWYFSLIWIYFIVPLYSVYSKNKIGQNPMDTRAFERFAGLFGFLAGLSGFLYSVAFIVLQNNLLSGLFLALGGLFATAVLTGVYGRVRSTDPLFALWAFLLGIAGGIGSVIHGGYDLANAINPPAELATELPNPIDPRGLLTFGIAGIAVVVLSWLIGRSAGFSKGLSYLGYLLGVLLAILYLARLIVLAPTNPLVLVPALLAGFLINPLWYIWLGYSLWRSGSG
jgi:hypothetical protein